MHVWTAWTWNPPQILRGLLKKTYFLCSHERLCCESPGGFCFLRLIMLTQSVFRGSASLEPLAQLHLSAAAAARTHTSNFLSRQYSAALCFAILIFCWEAHQSFESGARTSLWLLELFSPLKQEATNWKWILEDTRAVNCINRQWRNFHLFTIGHWQIMMNWPLLINGWYQADETPLWCIIYCSLFIFCFFKPLNFFYTISFCCFRTAKAVIFVNLFISLKIALIFTSSYCWCNKGHQIAQEDVLMSFT